MDVERTVHVCRYGRKTTSPGEQTIGKAGGNEAAFTNTIGKAVGNEATCTKTIGKAGGNETAYAICTVYAATDEQRK